MTPPNYIGLAMIGVPIGLLIIAAIGMYFWSLIVNRDKETILHFKILLVFAYFIIGFYLLFY